eukprot:TRINITY_DN3473_c0_g2_i1.p1 TRINITY_DN3473_c0_g2~~TRINITY_DN3473_c0_g2_i1.p1  ORF type:complete len:1483 (+),score=490.69 TRINITY_DN3473_c0_g2_i1:2923-7371(+)
MWDDWCCGTRLADSCERLGSELQHLMRSDDVDAFLSARVELLAQVQTVVAPHVKRDMRLNSQLTALDSRTALLQTRLVQLQRQISALSDVAAASVLRLLHSAMILLVEVDQVPVWAKEAARLCTACAQSSWAHYEEWLTRQHFEFADSVCYDKVVVVPTAFSQEVSFMHPHYGQVTFKQQDSTVRVAVRGFGTPPASCGRRFLWDPFVSGCGSAGVLSMPDAGISLGLPRDGLAELLGGLRALAAACGLQTNIGREVYVRGTPRQHSKMWSTPPPPSDGLDNIAQTLGRLLSRRLPQLHNHQRAEWHKAISQVAGQQQKRADAVAAGASDGGFDTVHAARQHERTLKRMWRCGLYCANAAEALARLAGTSHCERLAALLNTVRDHADSFAALLRVGSVLGDTLRDTWLSKVWLIGHVHPQRILMLLVPTGSQCHEAYLEIMLRTALDGGGPEDAGGRRQSLTVQRCRDTEAADRRAELDRDLAGLIGEGPLETYRAAWDEWSLANAALLQEQAFLAEAEQEEKDAMKFKAGAPSARRRSSVWDDQKIKRVQREKESAAARVTHLQQKVKKLWLEMRTGSAGSSFVSAVDEGILKRYASIAASASTMKLSDDACSVANAADKLCTELAEGSGQRLLSRCGALEGSKTDTTDSLERKQAARRVSQQRREQVRALIAEEAARCQQLPFRSALFGRAVAAVRYASAPASTKTLLGMRLNEATKDSTAEEAAARQWALKLRAAEEVEAGAENALLRTVMSRTHVWAPISPHCLRSQGTPWLRDLLSGYMDLPESRLLQWVPPEATGSFVLLAEPLSEAGVGWRAALEEADAARQRQLQSDLEAVQARLQWLLETDGEAVSVAQHFGLVRPGWRVVLSARAEWPDESGLTAADLIGPAGELWCLQHISSVAAGAVVRRGGAHGAELRSATLAGDAVPELSAGDLVEARVSPDWERGVVVSTRRGFERCYRVSVEGGVSDWLPTARVRPHFPPLILQPGYASLAAHCRQSDSPFAGWLPVKPHPLLLWSERAALADASASDMPPGYDAARVVDAATRLAVAMAATGQCRISAATAVHMLGFSRRAAARDAVVQDEADARAVLEATWADEAALSSTVLLLPTAADAETAETHLRGTLAGREEDAWRRLYSSVGGDARAAHQLLRCMPLHVGSAVRFRSKSVQQYLLARSVLRLPSLDVLEAFSAVPLRKRHPQRCVMWFAEAAAARGGPPAAQQVRALAAAALRGPAPLCAELLRTRAPFASQQSQQECTWSALLATEALLRPLPPAWPRITAGIRSLDLSGLSLDSTDVGDIADGMAVSTSLTELDLSRNVVGNSGARRLATALFDNCTLVSLTLMGTGVGAAGAEAFAGVLETANTTLRVLDLSSNPALSVSGGAEALARVDAAMLKLSATADRSVADDPPLDEPEELELQTDSAAGRLFGLLGQVKETLWVPKRRRLALSDFLSREEEAAVRQQKGKQGRGVEKAAA